MKVALLRLLLLAAILLAWELASGRVISAFFVSKPSAIAMRFAQMAWDGTLLRHGAITASEAIVGFLIGGLAGAGLGLLLGRSELLARVLDPFVTAFYSMPKVALAPLFILWFGVEFQMRVLFTAVIVLFLVFLNTYTGVRSVSRELVTVFRLMGAERWHLARMVVVPAALTWVFAGLRLSVPYALIGAIVAEIMAGNSGLGYLVEHGAAQFDTASVFAALFAVMILALLLNLAVRLAERLLMPWRLATDRQEVAV